MDMATLCISSELPIAVVAARSKNRPFLRELSRRTRTHRAN